MNSVMLNMITAPAYFVLGLLFAVLFKPFMSLPWYLTDRQFSKVLASAYFLLILFVSVRIGETYFIIHTATSDVLVAIGKASLYFLGFLIPFVHYRNRIHKQAEYARILAEKTAAVPGWSPPTIESPTLQKEIKDGNI